MAGSPALIQYEVVLPDGYPWAWAHETLVDPGSEKGPRNPAIKDYIRELAGHRCLRCGHPYRKGENGNGEWSLCDDRCRHGKPTRWRVANIGRQWIDGSPTLLELSLMDGAAAVETQAQWRILTVHHLDEDKANCRWWNLAALCQRCHLRMQRVVVMGRPYSYEHSEWFKPYAAGFYAWKYLGENLTRDETMARLDELLALEHRFTQEVMF